LFGPSSEVWKVRARTRHGVVRKVPMRKALHGSIDDGANTKDDLF
jgi:hypothetical protein